MAHPIRVVPFDIEGIDPEHFNRLVDWGQRVHQNRINREATANQLAQRETALNCGAVVVTVLMTLAGLIATVLSQTGFGSPDRGKAVRNSSTRLRDGAAGSLRGAQPSPRCWSGVAATSYHRKVGEQHNRVEAIAAADVQAADALEIQADQVEQARQDLEITLAALIGAITVAVVMQAQWKALEAVGSPIAPASEAALVAFGLVVTGAVIAAAITVLIAMDSAGKHTETALDNVIDAYQWVVDDVAMTMPTKVGRRPNTV